MFSVLESQVNSQVQTMLVFLDPMYYVLLYQLLYCFHSFSLYIRLFFLINFVRCGPRGPKKFTMSNPKPEKCSIVNNIPVASL